MKKISTEVYVAQGSLITVNRQFIENLKEDSVQTPRKRVRLNIHKNLDDPIHEMFIVHTQDTYVRPHKHLHKNESLHILEGEASIIFFDEEGVIIDVIPMANYTSGKDFYYKLSASRYHTLIVGSETLVFCETTNGPYKKSGTIFAPWSPEEKDVYKVRDYMKKLSSNMKKYLLLIHQTQSRHSGLSRISARHDSGVASLPRMTII